MSGVIGIMFHLLRWCTGIGIMLPLIRIVILAGRFLVVFVSVGSGSSGDINWFGRYYSRRTGFHKERNCI